MLSHYFRILTLVLGFLCGVASFAFGTNKPGGPQAMNLAELERYVEQIDQELAELPLLSMRSSSGTVGWRSNPHEDAKAQEWVQISFDHETPIDHLVLVPSIWRSAQNEFQADGFPQEFKIIAGNHETTDGKVIATITNRDDVLPRIAPLTVTLPEDTKASWLRIESITLSPRDWDRKYIFQMSEIFVFNGPENVSLDRPVITSSNRNTESDARNAKTLVDGFVPYLMNAAKGEQSIAYISPNESPPNSWLSIDLGAIHKLNRIHLHPVDMSDTVPQANPTTLGIPRTMLVEGATQPDFSDAVTLTVFKHNTVYDIGSIIMRNITATACRFIRFTAIEPYHRTELSIDSYQLGFAEIELFANGQNVALNKPIQASFASIGKYRELSHLTDGRNLYGDILPIREWLNELERRHDLERTRPIAFNELSKRYERQKTIITRFSWLAGLLAIGIVITFLIDRIFRLRHVAQIKERIAADLHDELGANVHAIGILSDVARRSIDAPEKLDNAHRRIRALTERTATAIQHCTSMLDANELYSNLVEEMHKAARRIGTNLTYELHIEGEPYLANLAARTRIDLFLFYKESLINVCRHSGATQFQTRLVANANKLSLEITDNGSGLPEASSNTPPLSLKRRARLLGAKVSAESPPNGGTRIFLTLKIRRKRRRI